MKLNSFVRFKPIILDLHDSQTVFSLQDNFAGQHIQHEIAVDTAVGVHRIYDPPDHSNRSLHGMQAVRTTKVTRSAICNYLLRKIAN
jgi:hypothetical protein